MAKRSQAWKQLERDVAEALGGKRITRGGDFSRSDFDVAVPDFPHWKLDAKYRTAAPWKHHGALREVRGKYCREAYEVPILVTKNGREHGACVTLSLRDFAVLVNALRGTRPGVER